MSDPILPTAPKPRRPLRPLQGIPEPDQRGPTGVIISSLLHALIILSLVLPPLIARQLTAPENQGAGGTDRAGGGGGGTGGSGGELRPERVRFLHFSSPPAAVPPPPAATPQPTPTPVPPPPEPKPEAPVAAPQAPQPSAAPAVATAGAGGGSGNDGSKGNGPGSGGGVGSGVGTGRGSGTGPGTGGGEGEIFPPTVQGTPLLPPLPVPRGVRPYKLVAQFEVDERGQARLLAFNPSRNSGYNRKIREALGEVRFRPATRADGTAVKDTAYITAEAP